jgi:hypothetical protein
MAMDKKGTGYKVKLTYICGHKEMNKMYGWNYNCEVEL